MSKQAIAKIFKGIKRSLKQHSPALLMGMGIAGMIITTVSAVAATPKAITLLQQKEEEKGEALTTVEKVKTAAPCYIPAATTMIVSVACMIGAEKLHAKKSAALAAAYTLSETARKEYGDKVAELFGQEKEQEVKDAIAKDKIIQHPPKETEVVFTEHGDTLCYDALSGRYFRSDIEKLRQAENELNHQLLKDMYVSLNDFYYAVGLSDIDLGEALGWNIDKGLVQLEFSSQLTEDGTPCLVVSHQKAPYYDYDA